MMILDFSLRNSESLFVNWSRKNIDGLNLVVENKKTKRKTPHDCEAFQMYFVIG